MEKIVINMSRTHSKWMKLMLKLQNSVPCAYKMTFRDKETARRVEHYMKSPIDQEPTWFRMIIARRGETVYIIKTDFIQEVDLQGWETKNE